MVNTSPNPGRVATVCVNSFQQPELADCTERQVEEMQSAGIHDTPMTNDQLRSALSAEREASIRKDEELHAMRTKLREEIDRSNRMYKKIVKLEEDIDKLTNQVESHKGKILQAQYA